MTESEQAAAALVVVLRDLIEKTDTIAYVTNIDDGDLIVGVGEQEFHLHVEWW